MTARPRFPKDGIALPVPSLDPITLWLRRFPPSTKMKGAVLLLHGGNSSGDAFLVPHGGVAAVLKEAGWDVWILEWHSSPYVVSEVLRGPVLGDGSVLDECNRFTFDRVVEEDIPAALQYIRKQIGPDAPLSIVGHCLGSGMAALACARGHLETFRIRKLVLCTLGLFVEVPWNGWLKPEDFILERVLHSDPECRAIDPEDPENWPSDFGSAAKAWPSAWLPETGTTSWQKFLHSLSFMVGQPYSIDRLDPSLRNASVESFFGPMHMGLYLHAAQSVRRGYMAPFNAPDILDRPRIAPVQPGLTPPAGEPPDSDLDPTWFRNKSVALIAAGQSRLWHRDSIDLMFDWLRSINEPAPGVRYTKQVFADYGLQELLWGENAQEVYVAIRDALE